MRDIDYTVAPSPYKQTVKEGFHEVLKDCHGLVTIACKKANIANQTYYRWREQDESFAKQCDEVMNDVGDFVENKLITRIDKEDTTAIIFYCKTKLKHRGYVERIEQTGANGGAIKTETKQVDPTDQEILDRYYMQRKKEEANE
jgi:hypothetical protein